MKYFISFERIIFLNLCKLLQIDMKKRRERFYKVPLCKSDCDVWFESCRYDFTCADNWFNSFKWDKNGNSCMPGRECLKFEDIFNNATNFCEAVSLKFISH